MSPPVLRLTHPALEGLAAGLESGRVGPPFAALMLHSHVPEGLCEDVSRWLRERHKEGLLPRHAALLLRMMAEERRAAQATSDRLQLVWSGLESEGSVTRDTAVVVQEMFRSARRSLLISTYALDSGPRAAAIFSDLARRLDSEPDLEVKLFVNVHPTGASESEVLREFRDHFMTAVWPGGRLPQVYYDPRSLVPGSTRACLHAKCIVVDSSRAFITSANFTEAAHARNLEAGVLVEDPQVAAALRGQFESLASKGVLRRVPGL